MLCKIGLLKNLAEFTAKFMWTGASGVSESRPCLAWYSPKIIPFLDVKCLAPKFDFF